MSDITALLIVACIFIVTTIVMTITTFYYRNESIMSDDIWLNKQAENKKLIEENASLKKIAYSTSEKAMLADLMKENNLLKQKVIQLQNQCNTSIDYSKLANAVRDGIQKSQIESGHYDGVHGTTDNLWR